MEMTEEEYNELAFDSRQYDEHEEWTDEQKAIAKEGREQYEELISYERLTGTMK